MKRVVSFGSYVFDQDTQGQFSDNFTNGVARTVRLPGLPGAFDELGMEPSPTEVGNLKLMFYIRAETREAITLRRDALRAMASWGVRKLVMQPANQSLSPRYCYARIQNIQMPENAKTPDTVQQVNIDWQVSYPRWMQDLNLPTWGSGLKWGDGVKWGGAAGSAVGTAVPNAYQWGSAVWGSSVWGGDIITNLAYTNNGNTVSLPRIVFTCSEAVTSGIVIERIDGYTREKLTYSGDISVGQRLVIDTRSLAVTLDGAGVYNNLAYTHPAWLTLQPGSNNVRVTLPTGGGTLRITYPHTWH